MAYASYAAETEVISEEPQDATLVTGATNGTLIRSLELSNPSGDPVVVTIRREDGQATPVTYAQFMVRVDSGDYLILWEDSQVFLPAGHALIISGEADGVQAVANCWEV